MKHINLMTTCTLTWHSMVKGGEFRSNLIDVFARLSKNEVGRVKIIPIRKMTFNRGLEALTIL